MRPQVHREPHRGTADGAGIRTYPEDTGNHGQPQGDHRTGRSAFGDPGAAALGPIVTVTLNPTIDICLEVDRLHTEGKNRARVRSVRAGGGGINVSRCVRRLGGRSRAVVTTAGDTGSRLEHLLAAEGLDRRRVPVSGETREALVVAENRTGCSYHIVPPGSAISATDIDGLLATIRSELSGASALVVTGSVPPGTPGDFTASVARHGQTAHIPVFADVAGEQFRRLRGERLFLVRLDRKEAGDLIGRPITSFADACHANHALLESAAAQHAVTTVGALGAVYSEPGADYAISAPPLPGGPRSDACAGDSLVAVLTYRVTRGDSILHACEYAVAAAAATVALPGTEVFEPATVEVLAEQVRIRRLDRHPDAAGPPRPSPAATGGPGRGDPARDRS